MELILKVRELVGLVRANDWFKAVALALEILMIITKSMDPNSPRPVYSDQPGDVSAENLAVKLETACMTQGVSGGPLGALLLPIVLALLKKLLLG